VANGWWVAALVLMAALVLVNGALIYVALRTRTQVQRLRGALLRLLGVAVEDLSRFEELRVTVPVAVKETIPVSTSVSIRQTVDVNVQGVVPVNETIRSEIHLNAPLIGRIPVDVSMPVNLRVPVNLDVPVHIEEDVPVSLQVPVNLDLPIEIDLRKTEIGAFIEQVVDTLRQLEDLVKRGTDAQ